MKGLIQKKLLASGIKAKYIFYLLGSLMLLSFLAPIDNYIILIAFCILAIVPLIIVVSIMNQTNFDNYKSEIILPVKKSKIIISYYIVYLIAFIISIFIVTAFIYLNYKLGRIEAERDVLSLLALGIGLILTFGGILFPGVLIFEEKNLKGIALASIILTSIPIRVFMEIIKKILKLDNVFYLYNYNSFILIIISSSFSFYILSCILSMIIFENKEF